MAAPLVAWLWQPWGARVNQETGLDIAGQGKCCAKGAGLGGGANTGPNSAAPTEVTGMLQGHELPSWGHLFRNRVVALWSLSCLAGQGWLLLLDEWPPFEAACCSYNPISVEVFKHLLQSLNIYFILHLGWKNRLEERVWERRSMWNTSVTWAVFKLKTACSMQSPSKWVKM